MPLSSTVTFSEEQIRAKIASKPYWFHRIEVAPGIVTPGEDDSPVKLKRLEIPVDLTGKRVLDIGAYEGFFSFECERRGAEVVAIDTIPPDGCGFNLVHELLGSHVKWYNASIYDLTPELFGKFDLVLCLGVIYHLRHPLLGLERVHSVCRGQLILETQVCDRYFIGTDGAPHDLAIADPMLLKIPIAQFYPGNELNGDPSNWWSPNVIALQGMLRSTGFVTDKTIQDGVRACIHCTRVDDPVESPWLEISPAAKKTIPIRPVITVADLLRTPQDVTMSGYIMGDNHAVTTTAEPVSLNKLAPAAPEQQHALLAEPNATTDNIVLDGRAAANAEAASSNEPDRSRVSREDGSPTLASATVPPIAQAAYERRSMLLESLPVGDISDKVCAEYSTGGQGFASVYRRLQGCAFAIGLGSDMGKLHSSAASLAGRGHWYGSNRIYMLAREDDLTLKEESIDIFFVNECLEQVDNIDAFLDEVYRALKSSGLLILTAQNADAYLFRINGDQHGVSPERISLMSYETLCSYLRPRFDILQAHGYNGSIHPSWDDKIRDIETARMWASQCADRPDMGTGVVLMARRHPDYRPARYMERRYLHDAREIAYAGAWDTVPLHNTMIGKRCVGDTGSTLTLDFEGSGIIVNFWCHPWSGVARVQIDGEAHEIDLYSSSLGGCRRVQFDNLPPGKHRLNISGGQICHPHSRGQEVIFYRAIAYRRDQEPISSTHHPETLA